MEADLARLLELQEQVEHSSAPVDLEVRLHSSNEIGARLIANQRQMVEVLIAIAADLAAAGDNSGFEA
jgi:putative aminopeptidase FrvX